MKNKIIRQKKNLKNHLVIVEYNTGVRPDFKHYNRLLKVSKSTNVYGDSFGSNIIAAILAKKPLCFRHYERKANNGHRTRII